MEALGVLRSSLLDRLVFYTRMLLAAAGVFVLVYTVVSVIGLLFLIQRPE